MSRKPRTRAEGHALHPTTPKKKKAKPADGMTDIERAYARHLDGCKARGEIRDYAFHPIKLLIVEGTPKAEGVKPIPAGYYTPDFLVVALDGSWSFHETKGHFVDNSAGWLAFKAAASRYPFPAYFVTLDGERWRTVEGVKNLIAGDWRIVRYGH